VLLLSDAGTVAAGLTGVEVTAVGSGAAVRDADGLAVGAAGEPAVDGRAEPVEVEVEATAGGDGAAVGDSATTGGGCGAGCAIGAVAS
jgi:hypothetical protein